MLAKRVQLLWLTSLVLSLGLLRPSAAAELVVDRVEVDYLRDVKPILKARCYACHGAWKQEAGLRVDTARQIRQGGESGAAVAAGNAADSLLVRRISADESERMPPEGPPLTPDEIAKIELWIARGAAVPDDEQPDRDPRDHWAFRVPRRPPVPTTAHDAWVRNPIDAFIAAGYERAGLSPNPPADRAHLLRRVYLDLVGFPPSAAELEAFLQDDRPGAYERVVERLLNSPQYGERWARHWMDVWRYSDWFGRRMVPDVWNSAPQIWRWRDWMVRSLNEDRGYDRMIQEMLAADEVAPGNQEASVATGYLVRNWYALNPNDWMRANVEHTAKAFLGLTFNCAHCHDHKYDPISHEDYFRFRAFFEPIAVRQDRVPGEPDPGVFQEYEYSVLRKINRLGAVSVYDKSHEAPTWFYTGGDERNRETERGSVAPGVPVVFQHVPLDIARLSLPPEAWYPGLADGGSQLLRDAEQSEQEARASQTKAAAELAAEPYQKLVAQDAQLNAEWQETLQRLRELPEYPPLEGAQSLVLDASTGRRTLHRSFPALDAIPEGSRLEFRLRIAQDSHVNLQLAKDTHQGLTAAFLGFDHGRILSYRPGTTEEFEVGTYDPSTLPVDLRVELQLEFAQDQGQLTVRQGAQLLAEQVPVALGGWNPLDHARQAVSLDVRTGTIAVFDDFRWTALVGGSAQPSELWRCDFESSEFTTSGDAAGVAGWTVSTFGQAPAYSYVCATPGHPELQALARQRQVVRAGLTAVELKVAAATALQEARRLAIASLQARLRCESLRYLQADAMPVAAKVEAVQAEQRVQLALAEHAIVAARQGLAEAQAIATPDAKQLQAIDAAVKSWVAAESARAKLSVPDAAAAAELEYAPLSPQYPQESTGRRRALAQWITHRENPLTARVAVNHIWMRHFHQPLVATVFDFGNNGAQPTHPELLDWLAVEFMDSGWSMKHLHRLLVTSHTYQLHSAAAGNAENLAADPDNALLWHMPIGTMEAEVVRDSLLYCGGRLDLRQGGQELENSEALKTYRRSLYYSCHPELDGRSPLGALFDAPNPTECYRRSKSILPQQALALSNSELIHELSSAIADQIAADLSEGEAGSDEPFVAAAFRRILLRPPSPEEARKCAQFLQTYSALPNTANPAAGVTTTVRARAGLVRVLFNHNDFVNIR